MTRGRAAGPRRRTGGAGWALLAFVIVLGAVFGAPSLVRSLNAPAISESFGVGDAVVALRLDARGASYLMLVNEAGQTRSVRVDERGFEHARIAWSSAGLSTGGPEHEYLLRENGLTEFRLEGSAEGRTGQARIATENGFMVMMGSPERPEAAFVDAASGAISQIDTKSSVPALAGCGDEVLMVREDRVETITESTRNFDGLDIFDGVEALACDAERAYGLGEISDTATAWQSLWVWDRQTGDVDAFEVRYPEAVRGWRAGAPFVHEGQLTWAVDQRLWLVRPPEEGGREPGAEGALPVVEAVPVAELAGRVGDAYPVVGTDEGILAPVAGRVYGVAVDEEWVERRRGRSYDRLDELVIFSLDAVTGEQRVEIVIDEFDVPKRDIRVTTIAVNPEWAVGP